MISVAVCMARARYLVSDEWLRNNKTNFKGSLSCDYLCVGALSIAIVHCFNNPNLLDGGYASQYIYHPQGEAQSDTNTTEEQKLIDCRDCETGLSLCGSLFAPYDL
jgi:hypothetical protein